MPEAKLPSLVSKFAANVPPEELLEELLDELELEEELLDDDELLEDEELLDDDELLEDEELLEDDELLDGVELDFLSEPQAVKPVDINPAMSSGTQVGVFEKTIQIPSYNFNWELRRSG